MKIVKTVQRSGISITLYDGYALRLDSGGKYTVLVSGFGYGEFRYRTNDYDEARAFANTVWRNLAGGPTDVVPLCNDLVRTA